MAQYIVSNNQNIYDIAVLLYGSIEGLYDLLISNPDLSMTTQLSPGTILEYHDFFKTNESMKRLIDSYGLVPANGERHVYSKNTQKIPVIMMEAPSDVEEAMFKISGTGIMSIDWGDDEDLEDVALGGEKEIQHYYEDIVEDDNRIIKVYGDFQVENMDLMGLEGVMYVISPLIIKSFVADAFTFNIDNLYNFNGLTDLTLRKVYIDTFEPIYGMRLNSLNISEAHVEPGAIVRYLQYAIDNNIGPCTMSMPAVDGGNILQLVNTLIQRGWIFNI